MTALKQQKPKVIKHLIPSEHDEQVSFVEWLEVNRFVFTSIPNAAKRDYKFINILKAEGLHQGLPDLLIIVKNQLVWIEMKKSIYKNRKNGGLSESQMFWRDALNKCANTQVFVCYGDLEAREVIRNIK